MSFLDWILGRKKQWKEEKVAEEPKVIELKLTEMHSFLEQEKRKKLSPAYPECAQSIDSIKQELFLLKKNFNDFAYSQPGEIDHRNIAVQMKENFLKRAPPLLEVDFPEEINYVTLQEFHTLFFHSLNSFGKILSDNKYLITFFRTDFEKISLNLKHLSEFSNKLFEKISLQSSVVKEFSKVSEDLSGIENNLVELNSLNSRRKKIVLDKENIVSALKELTQSLQAFDKTSIEKDVSLTEARIFRIRSSLSESLLLLQRPLRKYERICLDKRELKVLKAYSENPLEALLWEQSDYPQLKQVLASLSKAIDEKKVSDEARVLEKISLEIKRLLAGGLDPLVQELQLLEQRVEEKRKQLAPVKKLEEEKTVLEKKLGELEREDALLEQRIASLEKQASSKTSELESGASKATGATVKVIS